MAAGYESFYLRACHPDGGFGVWIRYTVHRRPGRAPSGSLWFTLFEESGPTATKLTVPDPVAGEWIRIAGARLGPGSATGRANDAEWDLRFTGADPLCHLPLGLLYRTPLPRTKPISVHPVARFDGALRVAGREIPVSGWPGMVGHNWGTQHAERWIWLHGLGFTGMGESTWLDLTFGRIRVGGRTTPWLANGAISMSGERIRLGGLGRASRPRVAESADRLEFAVSGRDIVVAGTARARRRLGLRRPGRLRAPHGELFHRRPDPPDRPPEPRRAEPARGRPGHLRARHARARPRHPDPALRRRLSDEFAALGPSHGGQLAP
jgi:hypothetical protein